MSTPLKGGAMLPPTAEELKGKSMDYKAVMAAISAGNEQAACKLLQQCNDAYYGDGTSSLTDAEFDAAQKAYTAKFGLPLKTAPTVKPAAKGRTDRHAGVAHDWPFLSGWLAKAAGKEELLDWYAKRRASANVSATQVGSPKWDGMSVVLTYDRHGNVQRALTRGDDGRGVDVTRLFAGECHFRDYDAEVRFGVKYEIVMTWSALDKLNSELDLELKNPRNTVAGIVASDESASRRKYITLVPLDIEWDDCEASRIERLEMMQSLFCPLLDENDNVAAPAVFTGNGDRDTPFFFWTAETDEEIQAIYDEVYSWRDQDDFEYMIDGVVFEFAALEDIELLGGRQCDCPDYAIAAKFPSMTGRTKVVSIDFDLGNTGRLTPVVNYEPITMDGRTFSRTSISNFVRFDALKLCVGTPIIVEIRGDVNQCASAG